MSAGRSYEILLAGCGAIGSRLALAALGDTWAFTFSDHERVQPENIGVSAFDAADIAKEKVAVIAARWRSRGGVGRALPGAVRYTVRPGLLRRLNAVILCLDNPAAVHDMAEVIWASRSTSLMVLALTCGGAQGGYQARLFSPPAVCPVCLFGENERRADYRGPGASCHDTSAPRASAGAAEAAAQAGLALLARWRAGDQSLANCRVQQDPGGGAYVVKMPPTPSPRCPVLHSKIDIATRAEDLGGGIADVTVAMLAARAMACAGPDAEILLARRAVPSGDLYCSRCRATAPAPSRLLPSALATWRGCACDAPVRSLGKRHILPAAELRDAAVASLSLAAWGAGHGDEFIAEGAAGRVRLCCRFDWSDLDG